MKRVIANAWRETPITTVCLSVAVILFLGVELLGHYLFNSRNDALWNLGAVFELVMVTEPQLTGFIDLWNGELWRIPISAFHHGSLLHLVMNGIAIWFLGGLLEPRMRPFGYANFLLIAALVSMLPEILFEQMAVGSSGVSYAMFGVLLVIRRNDETVAEELHDGIIQFAFIWLFLCVPLTCFDILPIANLSHFFGLGYGWCVGHVFYSVSTNSRFHRTCFYSAHFLLVPALYFVMHPIWLGRYHWYLARQTESTVRRMYHFQNALAWDRGLPVLWRGLAEQHLKNGNVLQAWKTMLVGLDYNRTDEKSAELCRKLWREMLTVEQRREAIQILGDVFREEELAWQQRLGILPKGRRKARQDVVVQRAPVTTETRMAGESDHLETGSENIEGETDQRLWAPPVDPDSPFSAARDLSVTL